MSMEGLTGAWLAGALLALLPLLSRSVLVKPFLLVLPEQDS